MKERDNMRKKREKTWQRVVKVQKEKPHFPPILWKKPMKFTSPFTS